MIKTRFAPSPTGYLHIGGLRTALYNYLFAKKNNGVFVLRIEDTDQKREVKGAVEALISTMQKIGLDWDEGPKRGIIAKLSEKGQQGPYLQSKRLKIYLKYAQKLLESGNAYICDCSAEQLEKSRQEQENRKEAPQYDGHCRSASAKASADLSKPCVIRLKVPENREVAFNDLIRGEVKFKSSEIDDQVLIKSDGFPTYHLANVVDDHLMEITHAIRGEEWLSSTPKHLLMYEAFGWTPPSYAHLPHLLNPDKTKLSKRQGDVAVEDYLAKGYLPEAIINYIALLGWHPADDREIYSLDELIKEFSLNRVQKAGAVFDLNKLNWFNNYYIKNKKIIDLVNLTLKFDIDSILQGDKELLERIITIQKTKINNLTEINSEHISGFIKKLPEYDKNILIFQKSDKQKTYLALEKILYKLKIIPEKEWEIQRLKGCLLEVVKENNLTNGDVFWATRVSVSGLEKSPPPEEIIWILHKKETLRRIKMALDKLNVIEK